MQALPVCNRQTDRQTDSRTASYGPDLMSSIFILGLEDVYMRKQLFHLRPKAGKTTVDFDKLVRAASEIATPKDNCAEALNTSVCGVSGNKNDAKLFSNCNTTDHSSSVEDVTDFWKLSTVIPLQTQRLWQGAGMEQASYKSTSVTSRPIYWPLCF